MPKASPKGIASRPSGESITIMHCESSRLQCHGCFATLSMTFTNAFYIETILEAISKAPKNVILNGAKRSECRKHLPKGSLRDLRENP